MRNPFRKQKPKLYIQKMERLQSQFGFGDVVFDCIGHEGRILSKSKRFGLRVYSDYGQMRWHLEDFERNRELSVVHLIGRPIPEDLKEQNGSIADYCNRLDPILAEALETCLKHEEEGEARDDVW